MTRLYFAGIVATFCDFLCHLFNHAGGCRCSNHRLYWWAWNLTNPAEMPSYSSRTMKHTSGRPGRFVIDHNVPGVLIGHWEPAPMPLEER